jgi:hypothetical protein
MISWLRGRVVMLACCALCGCQTIGNGRAFSAGSTEVRAIRLNQSTKEDVERQFGRAKVYRFANGYETWAYQKTEGIPRFVDYVPVIGVFTQFINDRVIEVAFLFDSQGILRNIDWRVD